jgi:hypothetical protein
MIDDPLALAVQMIAVLAAGMYPVGFLFGVCSDCCCTDECSKCTHYTNNIDGAVAANTNIVCTYIHREKLTSLSLQTNDVDSVTLENPRGDNPGFCLAPSPLILPENLWPIENDFGTASLCVVSIGSADVPDRCGCVLCSIFFTVRLQVTGSDYEILLDSSTTATLGPCGSDTIAFAIEESSNWSTVDFSAPEGGISEQAVRDAWIPFLNNCGISGTATIDPCECGACCEEGGEGVICSDNVAEGACPGDWQGVDTLCEDVTCGGTCCDAATGNCTYTTEAQCAGTWTAGGECEPNPCPQPPEGACCDGEGNCTQTIEADCSGLWSEGVECDPNPCPQPPTGACCQDGNCTETTEADCSGAWLEGVDCDPNPCTLQICCEYTDGDLTFSFGPVRADECAMDFGGLVQVWQAGGETECPPTNP